MSAAPADLARARLAAVKAARAEAAGRYVDLVLAGVLAGEAQRAVAQKLVELGQAEERARALVDRRHALRPTAAVPSVKPGRAQALRLVSSLPDLLAGGAVIPSRRSFSGVALVQGELG